MTFFYNHKQTRLISCVRVNIDCTNLQ